MRRAVHRREENQDWHRAQLLEGRLRLGVRGSRPDATAAGRSRNAGGREAVSSRNNSAAPSAKDCLCPPSRLYWCVLYGAGRGNETSHRKIFAVSAVGEEFFAAHDLELRERPGAIHRLSFAAGNAAPGR